MTTMSMRMASRFRAVSTSVSPFDTEEPSAETFTVSAERRFWANSKETRVRVEASKKRLTMVLPRSTGTFLIRRSDTSLKQLRRVQNGEDLLLGEGLQTDEVLAQGRGGFAHWASSRLDLGASPARYPGFVRR